MTACPSHLMLALAFLSSFTSLFGASADPKSPLLLGAAISKTSNVALLGEEQIVGISYAEAYFNRLGGVNGRPIKIQFADVAGDEGSAISAFQNLIKAEVLGIIGPTLSQQAFAADPVADKQGIPVIGPSNTAKGIPEIGNFVARVSAPVATVAPLALVRAMKENPKLKKVAILFAQNDAFSSSESETFQAAVKAEKNLELVSVQKFLTSDSDFTSQVTEVLAKAPDLVIISGLAADGGNLVRQLRLFAYKAAIIGGNGLNTPSIFPICQKHCDGILIAQAYSPEASYPMNQTLLKLAAEKQKRVPGQITAQAFTAVQVFVEALQRLDKKQKLASLPLEKLRAELNREILSGSYDTALGPIRFDPQGEIIQRDFYVAKILMNENGKDGRFSF